MSTVFLNEMQRNMDEDAALTEQRSRQGFQEDRSPEQEDMMLETEDRAFEQEDISLQEDMMMETEEFEEETEENFLFDGLLAAIKRRMSKE